MIGRQLVYGLRMLPIRLYRLVQHLILGNRFWSAYQGASFIDLVLLWFIELVVFTLDLLFVGDIYQCVLLLWNKEIRPLYGDEMNFAKDIFPSDLSIEMVKLNPSSKVVNRVNAWAYVGFHTIHFNKELSVDVFVHELVHVWQYERVGAVYIVRALYALHFGEAYDYGGLQGLFEKKNSGLVLTDFNFEQQAQIVQDFYTLSRDLNHDPIMLSQNRAAMTYRDVLYGVDILV